MTKSEMANVCWPPGYDKELALVDLGRQPGVMVGVATLAHQLARWVALAQLGAGVVAS